MQDMSGRGPRVQIGHLLIWIVGCAIGFAVRRPTMLGYIPSGRDRALVIGSAVVSGVALGTVLAGSGLLAYRRWLGDASVPSRAGQWLLLRALAVQALIPAAQSVRLPAWVYLSLVAMIDLGFFWGLRGRLPRHWVAVFLIGTLFAAVRAAGFVFSSFSGGLWAAINVGSALVDASALLWAVGRDRRSAAPADGLHRLGVGLSLALDASYLIFNVLYLAR